MFNEMKNLKKHNNGHQDYFYSSVEKMFLYYEMTMCRIR